MFLPVCRQGRRWSLRRLLFAGIAISSWLGAISQGRAASKDFLIDSWDTADDLPSSTVTSMAQTPDGYLWVGTYNGLARFDGVRFVSYNPVNKPELSHARVQGLYVDASGTLWINTYRGGLTSYRDGVFHRELPDQAGFDLHTTLVSSSSNRVVFVAQFGEVLTRTTSKPGGEPHWNTLPPPAGSRPVYQCVSPDGRLWFLTRDGHIMNVQDGAFRELPEDGGLAGKRVRTLVTDARGRVWAGATNEIAYWNGQRFESMAPTNNETSFDASLLYPTRDGSIWVLTGDRLRKASGRRWVAEAIEWQGKLGWASGRGMGMHEDPSGGLWFNHYGNGLFHITADGHLLRLTAKDGLPGDRVGTLFESVDGSLWVGVDRGGLARLRPRRFHVIGSAEGLPARTAFSVCEDRDGSIWIGTSGGGLCRWNNGDITSFPVGNNLSVNFVFSIAPRAEGGLWLSASEGEQLFEFHDGQIQHGPWELAHGIKSMLTDRAGRVWLGSKSSLAWWSPTRRRSFSPNDGMANSAVRALAEAPDGSVWAGADDGTLYRCEPDRLQSFHSNGRLAEQPIWSLWADRDGAIWIGTFHGGLLRFKDGVFSRFTAKQGLPADIISQILEDKQGRLWLGTHQGIFCAARSSLNACADGLTNTVEFLSYGLPHGLPTLECSDGYQPACWRASDGRLWFTTVRGVVSVNPEELAADSLPPPIINEEMRVDGELMTLGTKKLVIPPGHKQFEFRFTALNFNKDARFRYRIDGLDPDWVDAEKQRTARYGHLAPNKYQFRVIACNNEGVWTGQGATLTFTVKPYFYKTWWFLTLTSLGILAGVVLVVRTAAARKYRVVLAQLEQQHAIERDRARIAQDIHDDIGAGLTQITLLSELARREPEQARGHLDRISGSARQLTRAMDEIVWAVDPQHDTFSGLMDYVSAFAEDFLRMAGIRCRMDLPTALPEMPVEAELRYNLFLALKEALNNIVKHAHATEVWLRLRIEPSSFTLVIEDNGQGLPDPENGGAVVGRDRIASGSGLSNLGKRLTDMGGRCVVRSTPHQGTRVEMTLGINGGASPVVGIG